MCVYTVYIVFFPHISQGGGFFPRRDRKDRNDRNSSEGQITSDGSMVGKVFLQISGKPFLLGVDS